MCEEVCALPLGGGGLWWLYTVGAGSGDRAGFPSVGTAHLEGINLKPLHLLGLTSSSQLGANEGPAVYPHGVTPLPLQGLSPSSAEPTPAWCWREPQNPGLCFILPKSSHLPKNYPVCINICR